MPTGSDDKTKIDDNNFVRWLATKTCNDTKNHWSKVSNKDESKVENLDTR